MQQNKVILTTDNFAKRRNTLFLKNIKGNILVFFCSSDDENCKKFQPIFKNLSASYAAIKYGIFDMKTDARSQSLVVASRDTTTPIQSVPSLILYVDGEPNLRIPPKNNPNEISKIINDFFKRKMEQTTRQQPQRQRDTEWAPTQYSSGRAHVDTRRSPQITREFEDKEDVLLTPDSVIPYNTPWHADE
jgi:thioredoxin-like negative regulator of GroEL